MTGINLFTYCGNNPVNRIDPTGEVWWHWVLGVVVVAACAVVTVVLCGGFAATAFGGLTGGYNGYTMSKAQTPTSTPTNTNTSRGSTGRTEPANLREQLVMEQVKSNPSAGTPLTRITLNDPRWPSSDGWVKMQQIVPTSQGNINIHYVYNQTLKTFNDFKFNP